MYKLFFIIFFGVILSIFVVYYLYENLVPKQTWKVQSIDTMKYSRDQAPLGPRNQAYRKQIEKQVSDISKTGATHVAIGTPYDKQFYPVLKLWVESARKNKLKVWFRGNWAGWEGWFGYKKIDKQTHILNTKKFIEDNPELFADGDMFSSCPECENGSNVRTGHAQDVIDHRKFLIDEYKVSKAAFRNINKNVASNYFSMNGDLAVVLMDPATTRALDGIIVIDHYVKQPELLAKDVRKAAEKSGGKVMLGEFGAPVPAINGNMSSVEQKQWLEQALSSLAQVPELVGVNYWVGVGGTTALWLDDGQAKPAVETITEYFTAKKKVHKI